MTSTGGAGPATAGVGLGLARRIAGWIGARQRAVSDRGHASADARARARGWTVTASTGRFGFGARAYRDPRFDSPTAPRPSGWPGAAGRTPRPGRPRAGALRRFPAVVRKAAR